MWFLRITIVNIFLTQAEKGSQNGSGNKIRLKETEEDGQQGLAEGYNSNARYYLEQAKKVHATVKPTDDEEMVRTKLTSPKSVLIQRLILKNSQQYKMRH